MANRMKEDEKNEKIIRGLLKLPANRRCINCNSLGPQYVCINFWTFICTTCSGIHREFTHRVKSVSMAKFTSQEVSSLQGGGNERAKEIYFKEWDPQRHSVPDSSNVERLRDFIRHVYVDKRYTGERSTDKPPRVKMGDREDSYEDKRVDIYHGGSRSPPYEDTYERRYGERYGTGNRNDDRNSRYNYDERRSPGYDQESQRYGDQRRSPARFEVVDDRFGNGRRYEDRKFSDGESRLEGRSPNSQKDLDMSSPPMVRPVREILGEDVPPLRVGEPPKANGSRVADGSAHTQRTASSSSLGSIDGNSVELKRAISGSLIDFNVDPEPPVTAAAAQAQTTTPISQTVTQTATSSSIDGGNWASFDVAAQEKVSQPPSNVNTLESLLSQLSAPATTPAGNISALPLNGGASATIPVGNISMLQGTGGLPAAHLGPISTLYGGGGAPASVPLSNMSMFSVSSAPTAALGGMMSSGGDSFVKATIGGQWPSVQQHQHSLFTTTDSRSTNQQFTPSVGGPPNSQPWISAVAPNALGTLNTSTAQPSHAKPVQDTNPGVASQPLPVEAKSSGRTELPVDIFTATYSSVPAWQTAPPRGMGFGMQYPTAVSMPTFPQSSKSTNPFDLNTEPTLVQAPMFPSMASLQGALPSMAMPTGLLRTSSLGSPSQQWMPPQSPPYASTMPPSAYMGHQSSTNMMPFGHQGVRGFSSDGAVFGTLSTDQQLVSRYSQHATPNSFSSPGGNPFG